MTRDDVIRMAREAGGTEMQPYDYGARSDRFTMRHEVLERFATLVAAAEREVCAKVCELQDEYDRDDPSSAYVMKTHCIEAIRARGNE